MNEYLFQTSASNMRTHCTMSLLFFRYDLESDKLYSVTWYKDNEHIYSFSTRERKKKVHNVVGVKIDVSRENSSSHPLLLTGQSDPP